MRSASICGWLLCGLLGSGLVACSSDDNQAGSDGPAVTADAAVPDAAQSGGEAIKQENLTRLVTKLASDAFNGRDEGTPGSAEARKYIIDELTKCGVKPAGVNGSWTQDIRPGKGTNILGRIEGSGAQEKARYVALSAHYDHLGACQGAICNGADDNAAAVAIPDRRRLRAGQEPTQAFGADRLVGRRGAADLPQARDGIGFLGQ